MHTIPASAQAASAAWRSPRCASSSPPQVTAACASAVLHGPSSFGSPPGPELAPFSACGITVEGLHMSASVGPPWVVAQANMRGTKRAES